MATFWTGTASTADYGNSNSHALSEDTGWGGVMLNEAFNRAMLAQFDETDKPVCIDEEDAVMHTGCLECHHDVALHAFDPH